MDNNDLTKTAKMLAVEMTASTGELWRVHSEDHRTAIYSPSAYLSLYTGYGMRGRVEIRATAPREMREPTHGEKITCALDRTPEAIARDIITRLLPSAREHLTKSKAYDHQKRKEEATHNLKEKFLAKFLPHEWRGHRATPAHTNEYEEERAAPPISAHQYYDGTIEITTRLPIKEALQLIKHLKGE